jgi:hypothetical protein
MLVGHPFGVALEGGRPLEEILQFGADRPFGRSVVRRQFGGVGARQVVHDRFGQRSKLYLIGRQGVVGCPGTGNYPAVELPNRVSFARIR